MLLLSFLIFREKRRSNAVFCTLRLKLHSNLPPGKQHSLCFRNTARGLRSFWRRPDSPIGRGRNQLFFLSARALPTTSAEVWRTSSGGSGNVKSLQFPVPVS